MPGPREDRGPSMPLTDPARNDLLAVRGRSHGERPHLPKWSEVFAENFRSVGLRNDVEMVLPVRDGISSDLDPCLSRTGDEGQQALGHAWILRWAAVRRVGMFGNVQRHVELEVPYLIK